VTGCRECVESRVYGRAIGATWRDSAIKLDAYEEAVVAVCVHGTEWFTINGHNANAVLTGALSDELFCPGAEAVDWLVDDEGHLVATLTSERAHDAAECECVISRWLWIAALRNGCAPRCEERIEIDTKERRWYKANEAECGVAATNVGRVQEEATRIDHLRDSVNARRRVTDCSEVCRWLL
jgi:hypothetical protein